MPDKDQIKMRTLANITKIIISVVFFSSWFSLGYAQTLVNETFSGATLPTGWTAQAGSQIQVLVDNSNFAGGTAREIDIDALGASTTNNSTTRLICGPLNTTGMSSLLMSWRNYMRHFSSSYAYTIRIQTSSNGTTWNNTSWVTSPVTASIGPGTQNLTINTADVGSSTFYVCFYISGNLFGAFDWYIDNVFIENGCTKPTVTGTTPGSRCGTGTVSLGATASAGTINWYAAATGGTSLGSGTTWTTPSISSTTTYYAEAANGGCVSATRTAVVATVNSAPTITSQPSSVSIAPGLSTSFSITASNAATYQWQYATAAGGPWSNVSNGAPTGATYTNATTTTLNVSGITAAGTYYYRCVATSGTGCGTATSNNATLIVGTTYCSISAPSLGCSGPLDRIRNVTLNTLNYTTICGGYTYYPSFLPDVARNSSTILYVTVGVESSAHGLAAWFDFNQDGDFADAGEYFLISNTASGTGTNNIIYSLSISVPATAALGNTRMRIIYLRGVTLNSGNSCINTSGNYGEVEDYMINIVEPHGNTFGIFGASDLSGVQDCEIKIQKSPFGIASRVSNSSGSDLRFMPTIISSFPVINIDNVSCTNTNISISTTGSSPTWVNLIQSGTGSFSTAPSSANPIQGSYSSVDRKTIRLTTSTNVTKYHFLESFEGLSSSSTFPPNWLATNAGSGAPWLNTNAFDSYHGDRGAYCQQASYASNADAWLFTPAISMTNGIRYYVKFYEKMIGSYTESMRITYGNAQTKASNNANTLLDLPSLTNNSWAPQTTSYLATSSSTNYFGFNCYSTTGQFRLEVDSVSVYSIEPTIDYTDFINIMMAAPTPSALNGVTNTCPGVYNFSSPDANTPGYTYSWSVNTVSGNTPVIYSATSSSTLIDLPNKTNSNITYTITCSITSECCGQLTPVTYSATIYPDATDPSPSPSSATPCPGGTVTLSSATPANANFNWYTTEFGGTPFASGSSVTSPTISTGTNTFYVESVNSNGCTSTPRVPITVTGTQTAAPTATGGSTCGTGDVTLSVSSPVAGYTYNWYSGSCSGTLLQSSTSPYYTATGVGTTTNYYVAAVPSGCNPGLCATVTATVQTPPTTVNWLGAVGGANNWFNTSNWTSGCIPSCANNVIIPVTANNPDIGLDNSGPAETKDLTLQGSTTLSFSDSKAELDICGNFTHAGTLTTNNYGTIVFKGSIEQTYSRTISSNGNNDFFNVTINNTSANPGLTIKDASGNKDFIINSSGSLTFVSGKIFTEGNRMVDIRNNNTASLSGHGLTSGYVAGKLKRAVTSGSYDFPLGNLNAYELMNINFLNISTTTNVTTNFGNYSNGSGSGLPLSETVGPDNPSYTSILNCGGSTVGSGNANPGLWTIIPDAGTPEYTMTLYGRNYSNSSIGHTILKRSTFNTGCTNAWALNGVYNSSWVAGNVVTVIRRNMTGFSQVAIVTSTTPLPLNLLSFDLLCSGSGSSLQWTTASEQNVKEFIIEHSSDGEHYTYLGSVPSTGNSKNVKTYHFNTDVNVNTTNYFKLSEKTLDGNTNVLTVKELSCSANPVENTIQFMPNPTSGKGTLLVKANASDNKAFINVYDYTGRLLQRIDAEVSAGMNAYEMDFTSFAPSLYIIEIRGQFINLNTKVERR
jgi:hypothetical protein